MLDEPGLVLVDRIEHLLDLEDLHLVQLASQVHCEGLVHSRLFRERDQSLYVSLHFGLVKSVLLGLSQHGVRDHSSICGPAHFVH